MPTVVKQLFIAMTIGLLVLALIWRLPVNGWGSLAWLGGHIAMAVIRNPHFKANKMNIITRRTQGRLEKSLLFLVALGGTLVPGLHLLIGTLSPFDYTPPLGTSLLGVTILIIGLYLFYRSHADLGKNWSVTTEIRNSHTLVTTGIYQRIRHPMYSAIWLIFLAQPLLVHNWIAGWAGILAFGLMYVLRVPYEEAMMAETFGDEYEAYERQTGRLFPKRHHDRS